MSLETNKLEQCWHTSKGSFLIVRNGEGLKALFATVLYLRCCPWLQGSLGRAIPSGGSFKGHLHSNCGQGRSSL